MNYATALRTDAKAETEVWVGLTGTHGNFISKLQFCL